MYLSKAVFAVGASAAVGVCNPGNTDTTDPVDPVEDAGEDTTEDTAESNPCDAIYEPASGTTMRTNISTAIHTVIDPTVVELGTPRIIYSSLSVYEEWAFAQGSLCVGPTNNCVPLTTDDLAETAAWGDDIEDGMFDGNRFEAIVDLGGGGAEVVNWAYGSTDVWYDGANETYGFPEELLWGCER